MAELQLHSTWVTIHDSVLPADELPTLWTGRAGLDVSGRLAELASPSLPFFPSSNLKQHNNDYTEFCDTKTHTDFRCKQQFVLVLFWITGS